MDPLENKNNNETNDNKDNSGKMLKCPCPEAFVSTYRDKFRPLQADKYALRAQHLPQQDEALISHHFHDNLIINGARCQSKIWPKTAIDAEEYKDFLRRLECCKKQLYHSFFQCPVVDLDILEKMLRDLEKTVYQLTYSPNEFESRKASLRCAKMAKDPSDMKYYETTYRMYYNRIEEVERFKPVLRALIKHDDKTELNEELRKLHKAGKTTYYMDICIPAIEKLKAANTEPGPLDRYTDRRL